MRKARWYVRQALPLKYATGYVSDPGGESRAIFHTWRMWFGRSFAQRITDLGHVV